MTDECVDVEMLGEIVDAPAGDTRRRHIESCPRCWSRLRAYEAFFRAELVSGANPEAAESLLSKFFEARFALKDAHVTPPSRLRHLRNCVGRAVRVLAPRPVWAVAGLIIVAGGLAWWHPWVLPPTALRGSFPVDGAPLQLHPVVQSDETGVDLAWEPHPGADAYEVRLYGPDLAEVARLGPVTAAAFTLRRSDLPENVPDYLSWRVFALQHGDQIAVSAPAPLEWP